MEVVGTHIVPPGAVQPAAGTQPPPQQVPTEQANKLTVLLQQSSMQLDSRTQNEIVVMSQLQYQSRLKVRICAHRSQNLTRHPQLGA